MITFTKEQLIASAHARIEFAEMMLAGELEPLKERTWSIELELARIALASLEAEPVAYIRSAHNPDGFCFADGIHPTHRHQRLPLSTLQDGCYWKVTPLYTATPAPVSVPDDVLKGLLPDAEKAEFWFEHNGKILFEGVKFNNAVFDACRAAMLQGAEPVTTAYKFPANTPCKDAPENIWLQTAGVWPENGEFSELTWCSDNQHQDDTLYIRADVVTGNSPVISDGWVACSDRMPEPKRWLALYGARVFTHGAERGQPYEEPRVDEGYLGSDGQFYLLNWEQPGILDDNYNNDLAVATHWMYWELPAAPQQEVK